MFCANSAIMSKNTVITVFLPCSLISVGPMQSCSDPAVAFAQCITDCFDTPWFLIGVGLYGNPRQNMAHLFSNPVQTSTNMLMLAELSCYCPIQNIVLLSAVTDIEGRLFFLSFLFIHVKYIQYIPRTRSLKD